LSFPRWRRAFEHLDFRALNMRQHLRVIRLSSASAVLMVVFAVGPPDVATSIKASIASCHSG
jgi:hypothetical protein